VRELGPLDFRDARISSEVTVTFSISSIYLCSRRKSAGVMILPSTTRGQ
jgi:hypothetical protein